MRIVRIGAINGMQSPIRFVMAHLHEALVNIAPEMKASFASEYDEFILDLVDDHRWICDVDVANKHIRISKKVVEVLWASSLAYFRLYLAVQRETNGRASVSAEIEFADGDAALHQAMKLLHWAFDSWLNETDQPWPDDLPCPVENPVHASDEHAADELSLAAAAFILHHELSHIRLRHTNGSELESERDTDQAAADWVLAGLEDQTENRFVKRSLGIAVALAILVAKGIHIGHYGGVSHPRSFDRLMYTFDQRIEESGHPVWFFIAVILKLHLDNVDHGAPIPPGPFDSPRECVNAYVDALSRLPGDN